ncbi:hypothetical protein ACFLZ7_02860 [Nanoarchaeota archaeon]
MTVFDNALQMLDYWGLSDVLLPFILVFTVAFSVLQKAKIFGEEKRYNTIVALVLSLGVVIPHSLGYYTAGVDVVDIINNALPGVSLALVIVVMFMLLLGVMGATPKWGGGTFGGIVTLIAFVLVVAIFGSAAGWWETSGIMYWLDDSDIQATIVIIVVFWILMYFITSSEEEEGLLKSVGDWWKKQGGK